VNLPRVIDLRTDAGWNTLRQEFEPNVRPQPLLSCLEVLRREGAKSVAIEHGYRDRDYASEYIAYLKDEFQPPAVATDRFHFFGAAVRADTAHLEPQPDSYLGFINRRNSPAGRVGRTLIRVPKTLSDSVQCAHDYPVSVFGRSLTVRCVPYAQQDGILGRCAHIAAWIAITVAAQRGITGRRLLGDLATDILAGGEPGRTFPSSGLSVAQLSSVLERSGVPPMFHAMGNMPSSSRDARVQRTPSQSPGRWDTRVVPVTCRLLNSGFPVIVVTQSHAFTLVGYQETTRVGFSRWYEYVRHDDEVGPYRIVENALGDVDTSGSRPVKYGPWRGILTPLPPGIWLSAEVAERTSITVLQRIEKQSFADLDSRSSPYSVRTYARRSAAYLDQLTNRNIDGQIVRHLRFSLMPRWIWVTEVIDRSLRDSERPSCIAEVVVDPTSPEIAPTPIAFRTAHQAWVSSGKNNLITFGSSLAPARRYVSE